MSGGFPVDFDVANTQDQGTSLSATTGTLIAPSASANTLGAFVQLVASTPNDCSMLTVFSRVSESSTISYAINIAIGAGGAEKIIVNNLMVAGTAANVGVLSATFPMEIPSGTRLSAQTQSNTA